MKNSIFIFLAVLFAGCSLPKTETTFNTEPAVVTKSIYTPAQHGSGIGFGMNGNISVVSTSVPEEKGFVFTCQHGSFYVRSENLWLKLKEGDSVVIGYNEVYRVRDTTARLVDYDFLFAIKDRDTIWQR